MVIKSIFIICFNCLLFSLFVEGQIMISGNVYEQSGKPIVGANITLSQKHTNTILTYTISDSKGNYHLQVNENNDSLLLRATYIGYSSFIEPIFNTTQKLDIQLNPTDVLLKTVTVKQVPIYQVKDTLNYDVKFFSNQQDRSISDVLKKLPGVEVESSGRVLYQGKPIQKLDINGMNLLEGKYSLATNNLPADAVKNIQIIENDQPIKALKGIIPSDRASINLQIKKYKVTGFAKMGIGAKPLLWDANFTPISIFKNMQMLNTYQTNNVGKNVSKDLKNLTMNNSGISVDFGSDFLDFDENKNAMLFVRTPSTPPFEEQSWLNNNIHLLSNHFLKKLSEDTELRMGVSYVNNHQMVSGLTTSIFNTSSNVVRLVEEQQNNSTNQSIMGNLGIRRNNNGGFLENKLFVQKSLNTVNGLLNNSSIITQNFNDEYLQINNQLKFIKKVNNNLYTLLGQIAFNKAPQQLNVSPGVYAPLLNDSLPYQSLSQQLQLQQFYAHHSLGFINKFKNLSLQNKIGWMVQRNDLNSHLNLNNGDSAQIKTNDFSNKISFLQSDIYYNISTIIKGSKTELRFSLPAYWSLFNISNAEQPSFTRGYLMPNINLKYDINSAITLFANSGKTNTFGRIHQLYNSYILVDYRTLQRRLSVLPETVFWNNSLYLTYKNPLSNLFWNISFNHNLGAQNIISKYAVDNNGAFNIENLKIKNPQKNTFLSGEIGRFFTSLKTTFKLKGGMSISKQKIWIENDIDDINGYNYFYGLNVNSTIEPFFFLQYNNRYTTSFSKLGSFNLQKLTYQGHQASITSLFSKKHSLMFQGDYYTNNIDRRKQLLFNIQYRYNISKSKIDIEIKCNNLFNTKEYMSIYNDSFTNIQNVFLLRPRQFLISIRKGF